MTTEMACTSPQIGEGLILARFARRAAGMTGADVEYVVQQAQRAARREGRLLGYSDVEKALDEARPRAPNENRWRFAIHEAAHAVIGLTFRFERIQQITLSGRHGDPSVTSSLDDGDLATEVSIRRRPRMGRLPVSGGCSGFWRNQLFQGFGGARS
jgi:ATP-dependent Zn protease